MQHVAHIPKISIALVVVATIWSVIAPHDYFTWMLETFPVFIGLFLLLVTAQRFPLTHLVYTLLTVHALILLVGGHYTYAEVPLFNWLRDAFDLSRNHFDRVGHFMQGFVPAMVARELLLRTSPLRSGKWLFAIIAMGCLGISACYELLEWLVAAATGEAAEAFLGTQGDMWDTQKDMGLALLGALSALLLLGTYHDRQIEHLKDTL